VSGDRDNLPAVIEAGEPLTTPALPSSVVVPVMIADAGERAVRRFLEFFAASINNDNTRMAYYRAACSFFAWLDQHRIGGLADIEPLHVAAYVKALEATASKPTVKQHLAAIRMLFDWLIVGQILAVNPAHAVRGPKHVVKRGKTPVLNEEQARHLAGRPRYFDAGRFARPRADRRDDLYLRPYRCRRRHACRGLLSEREALVAAPARKRRQAPRNAGASQA
jgi:Phage integrase, N-terminal SAM-like domain